MSETIPNYIRDYLFGAKPPAGCCVLEGSLPALVEGNLSQAKVATVGINPHGGLNRDKYPPWMREAQRWCGMTSSGTSRRGAIPTLAV